MRHELTPVDMLLARCTMTTTGYPASLTVVQMAYKHAMPALEDAWFWIGATQKSSEWIREHGHKAVGTVMTTWIPPQTRPVLLEEPAEVDVPVVGTPEYVALSLAERGRHD